MNVLSRLREKQAGRIATATPATFATQGRQIGVTVASVATVTVANLDGAIPNPVFALPAKVVVEDTATTAWRWLIHYLDREPIEATFCPAATRAEVLGWHPEAVAAEPFTPTIRQPSAPLTASEETAIRAWLGLIEETDPTTIAEVIGQCQRDADARCYFTGRAAAELAKSDPFPDDRRTCDECANLIARRCQAARRGEIVATRNYEPIPDLLRRCEGYAPGAADSDRRHGRERWPGLVNGGE